MKRKLVKQGRNALTVTLPAEWTKKFGLKAGDEVDVEELGKNIVVGNEKSIAVNKIEFDTTKLNNFRSHYISYFYHKGFDEVKLIYDNPEVLTITKNKLNDLMGYEIVETGRNYIIIKSISEAVESEFDNVLRRVFLMLKSMAADCLDAIRSGQYSRLKDIKQMEKTNNKLTDFCIRIMNKKGYKEYHKTIPLYSIIRELEKICDNYKYICDSLSDYDDKTKISDETLNLFEKTNDYLTLFYELFYKFDEKRVDDLFNRKDELIDKGNSLFKEKTHQEKMIIQHLMNLTRQIFELKGPYLEMSLHS